MIGDAGLQRTEIVLIPRKWTHKPERWVHLDAGLQQRAWARLDERIHYRIAPRDEGLCAGDPRWPDVRERRYPSPASSLRVAARSHDRRAVNFLSAGIHIASAAAVAFDSLPTISNTSLSSQRRTPT
jgi:hypothetical protein